MSYFCSIIYLIKTNQMRYFTASKVSFSDLEVICVVFKSKFLAVKLVYAV